VSEVGFPLLLKQSHAKEAKTSDIQDLLFEYAKGVDFGRYKLYYTPPHRKHCAGRSRPPVADVQHAHMLLIVSWYRTVRAPASWGSNP
jgi:hypothetical protein